jgi:hypothetical protein
MMQRGVKPFHCIFQLGDVTPCASCSGKSDLTPEKCRETSDLTTASCRGSQIPQLPNAAGSERENSK